jgi:hypothetical protein
MADAGTTQGPSGTRTSSADGADRGDARAAGGERIAAVRGPSTRGVGLIMAAIVLLAPVSGLLFAAQQDPTYGAQAEVVLDLGDMANAPATRRLQTARVLARSRLVLEPVAAQWELSPEAVDRALTVTVVDQSSVLQVQVAQPDPETARGIAQEVAQHVVTLLPDGGEQLRRELMEDELDRIAARLQEYEGRLRDLEGAEATAPDDQGPMYPSADERLVQEEITQLLARRTGLTELLLDLDLGEAQRQAPRVVDAFVLEQPLSPNRRSILAISTIVGVALATGFGVLMWWRRYGD